MAIAFNPFFQYTDSNGAPLDSGRLRFLDPATSNEKAIYTDYTGGTPLTNPVVLESDGRVAGNGVWLGTGYYTVQVQEFAGNDEFGDPTYSTIEEIQYVEGADAVASAVNYAVFSTWDALQASTSGVFDYARIMGRLTAGDLGGGWFWWNSASTASDNGGTILAPTDSPSTGRWIREFETVAKASWFGALPNLMTATDAQLVSANTWALNNNIGLYIDSGEYTIVSAKTFTVACELGENVQFSSSNAVAVTFTKPLKAGLWRIAHDSATLSVVNAECPAEWWGVYTDNTGANNVTAMGTVTTTNKVVFTAGTYAMSALTTSKRLKVYKGSKIAFAGNSTLSGGIESNKAGISISGAYTLAITAGQDVRLSWFDDGSALATIVEQAHRACNGGLNRLVWDVSTASLGAYIQTNGAGNYVESGMTISVTDNVTLKQFQGGVGSISVLAGQLTLSEIPRIKAQWFTGLGALQEALDCACLSGIPLDGESYAFTGSVTLSPSGDVDIYNLKYASSSQSFDLDGNYSVRMFNCELNDVVNSDGNIWFINCKLTGDCSIQNSKLVSGTHSGGEFVISNNVQTVGTYFNSDFIKLQSVSGEIKNVQLQNITSNAVKSGASESGYISFVGVEADTTVTNVYIDANFTGSADANFELIQVSVGIDGSFDADGTAHSYFVKNNPLPDANMILPCTEVSGKDAVFGDGAVTSGFGYATLDIDPTSDARFLEFGGGLISSSADHVWVMTGTVNPVTAPADLFDVLQMPSTATYVTSIAFRTKTNAIADTAFGNVFWTARRI